MSSTKFCRLRCKIYVHRHFYRKCRGDHNASIITNKLFLFLRESYSSMTVKSWRPREKIVELYEILRELFEKTVSFLNRSKNRFKFSQAVCFFREYLKLLLYRESLTESSFIFLNRKEDIELLYEYIDVLSFMLEHSDDQGLLTVDQFNEIISLFRQKSFATIDRDRMKFHVLNEIGKLPKSQLRFRVNQHRKIYKKG